MSTMADRIKELLTERKMDARDLIREKIASKAGVYFLLDGTTSAENVRASTVLELARVLRTSPNYIVCGKGPRDSGHADARLDELVRLYEGASDTNQDAMLGVARALTHAKA